MNFLDLEEVKPKSPSTYSIYKRIATLFGVVVSLTICVNLWLLSTEHAQNWHDKQANQLGRSLVKQAAHIMGKALVTEDKELIEYVWAVTLNDDHVIAAAIFDELGRPYEELAKPSAMVEIHKHAAQNPLVFVEEITHQQQLLGYLRLQLKPGQVMRFHDEYQNQLFEQSQVLMLLAFIAGAICTRAFYKWRIRRYLLRRQTS